MVCWNDHHQYPVHPKCRAEMNGIKDWILWLPLSATNSVCLMGWKSKPHGSRNCVGCLPSPPMHGTGDRVAQDQSSEYDAHADRCSIWYHRDPRQYQLRLRGRSISPSAFSLSIGSDASRNVPSFPVQACAIENRASGYHGLDRENCSHHFHSFH